MSRPRVKRARKVTGSERSSLDGLMFYSCFSFFTTGARGSSFQASLGELDVLSLFIFKIV
jgi:hypothetical protein